MLRTGGGFAWASKPSICLATLPRYGWMGWQRERADGWAEGEGKGGGAALALL